MQGGRGEMGDEVGIEVPALRPVGEKGAGGVAPRVVLVGSAKRREGAGAGHGESSPASLAVTAMEKGR
jgi:hypothetical protein